MVIKFQNEVISESAEVLYTNLSNVAIDREAIATLQGLATHTNRGRLRLCAHLSADDHVHEMFIVHPRGAYVPPHKHLGKSESMLVLAGECEHVLFDDEGQITGKRRMGDFPSGFDFFLRMSCPVFHSLVVLSDQLVFLEITKGPFDREDTVTAPWAPEEKSSRAIEEFFADIRSWGVSCGN
jgi:cupin fold WbuC family metalloprotein